MNILAAFWPHGLLTLALIMISCLLMLVILIQKGRGGGLSGAFGGGGGGSTAFGTKTGDVFTWITIGLASLFVLLAIVGTFAFDQSVPAVAAAPIPPPTPATGTAGVTGSEESPDLDISTFPNVVGDTPEEGGRKRIVLDQTVPIPDSADNEGTDPVAPGSSSSDDPPAEGDEGGGDPAP